MDGSETIEDKNKFYKNKINQEEERFQTNHQNSILQGIKILKTKWILLIPYLCKLFQTSNYNGSNKLSLKYASPVFYLFY